MFVIAASVVLSGCAYQTMSSQVSPIYETKITPVSSLGLTGGGASVAFPAFINKGYKITDMSNFQGDLLEDAKKKSVTYLVTVDSVGTDGAWWDGNFDYSMRATNTESGSVVWSATAEYGEGATIKQVKSTNRAMYDMVNDFAKNFPPK
jgi:hypothetical protein